MLGIIGEIIEKRTLNEKHFLNKDGTIVASVYPMNVHYEENGKLVDIDNSLSDSNEEKSMVENKSNAFKIKFSKKANKNKLAQLKIGNSNIKWSLQNSNKVEAVKVITKGKQETSKTSLKNISSGTIKYENILENIDIEYNVVSSKIKENIILKDKDSINQELSFEYDTNGLQVEKTEEGKINFYANENKEKVVFFLDVPYMYDAKGETSADVEMELLNEKNKTIIKVKPNKEWLESEERGYPVTIDPTVQTSTNVKEIEDTFIFNGGDADSDKPFRYEADLLRVGNNNKIGKPTRTLIKFTLPQLNSGDQVIGAMLNMCTYLNTNKWTPTTTIQIDVHKMTLGWNSRGAKWSELNDKYDHRITDYVKHSFNKENPWSSWDITSIVKEWYITGNNNGLMLKDRYEADNVPQSDSYFYSVDADLAHEWARPSIQIVYRNQTGLESYQTYHSQNVGRAGTVYTNDYNGNVVLIHQDLSTPGNLMQVSVNHVYNTNDKDVDIGYGKGFRLNLSQTVNLETINGTEYAKYKDEDGTAHYLKKEGSEYKDEDGLSLTLTKESNGNFKMKDKQSNVLIFQNKNNTWYLQEAQDTYGNKITIELNSNGRIQKATDAVGDNITFTYAGDRLDTVKDKNGRTIKYTYNSNNNITQITYWDNQKTLYEYNDKNLLSSVKNIDNSRIDYEYYNEQSNRVKSIKAYGIRRRMGK